MYTEMSWESATSKQVTEHILAANRLSVIPKHPLSFDFYRGCWPTYSGVQVHEGLDKAGALRVLGGTPVSMTLCTTGCYSDPFIMVSLPTLFACTTRQQSGTF